MKYLRFILFYFLFLSVIGCTAQPSDTEEINSPFSKMSYSEPTERYENFRKMFTAFKTEFKPEGFTNISPDYLMIKTVSFPENKIDERKANTIDHLVSNPTNFEQYYQDDKGEMLVKVNFFFNEERSKTGFIGINTFIPQQDENIIPEKRNEQNLLLEEYYLSFGECMVIIHFMYNQPIEKEDIERVSKEFIQRNLLFYEQFESEMLTLLDQYFQQDESIKK